MTDEHVRKGVGTGAVEIQEMKEIFPLWRLSARMEGTVRCPGVGSHSEQSPIGAAHAHQIVIAETGIVDAQVGPARR